MVDTICDFLDLLFEVCLSGLFFMYRKRHTLSLVVDDVESFVVVGQLLQEGDFLVGTACREYLICASYVY